MRFCAIVGLEASMEAVKRNGYALQYVKDQTEAICLEAVKEDGYALRYVKDQTEAICLEAVKRNGYALRYVLVEELFLSIAAKFGIKIDG